MTTVHDSTGNRVRPSSVFVGGPFFQLVDPDTGLMPPAAQERITRIIAHFEDQGAKVYNAHRRESWGAEFLTAPECTKLDFTEISQSDVFVAYPGVPVSPGTHVEVGWASALGKPMVLLLERDAKHTFLVTGLETIANVEFIWFDTVDEILQQLPDAVHRVLSRSGPAVTGA
jgi:nucleoside 2-deoxyribosyltransferase